MVRNCWKGALAMWCALLWTGAALAGEFTINPTRLELGAAARSGAITVRNEGKRPLSFQLQAMEWAQDAAGQDQYTETRDLIYFPRILTIEPGQEGVVRVGTRTPVVPAERTYRLFIEELPGNAKESDKPGVQITFLIRFGAPIFITPIKPQDGVEIEGVALANGELSLSARNVGNRHQIIKGIHLKGSDAAGKEVYSATIADRYLLAGAVKPFKTVIAREQCVKISALEVEVETERLNATRKLDVSRAMCAPK